MVATRFEVIKESCRMCLEQYDALQFDGTMATAIEATVGDLFDVYVAEGVLTSYTVDASVASNEVPQVFGMVKVAISLVDTRGERLSDTIVLGGEAVNPRSHNT